MPLISGTTMYKPLVVLSGCSGGGKSTLILELARRGHTTFDEPGRAIVQEQMQTGGNTLPTTDPIGFAELCISRAINHFEDAPADQTSFCDRSIIDAVSFLDHHDMTPEHSAEKAHRYRYADDVFLTPPWPEIFTTDAERTHSFEDAVAEYERLVISYPQYGYRIHTIPKSPVAERADYILQVLNSR
ncbi:MAG: AAA family ATPase [Alphaproteobacteria bacterium]|uniref:AAA family ATPase n=1 Tax=Pyruvatibacter sp. HU-CL02332 TaxID=3127650 RepID=UPI00296A181D|nr:AAA family ATPase [Alphaproteobacteria bacterium]